MKFIIGDHPVCIHDPLAAPGRPGGWFSSPAVEVTFSVDRRTCLLLRPGPGRWQETAVSATTTANLNLRSYANSQWKTYGSGQHVMEQVWSAAKRNKRLVAAFAPRPQRMPLVEQAGERPGAFDHATMVLGPEAPQIRRFRRRTGAAGR